MANTDDNHETHDHEVTGPSDHSLPAREARAGELYGLLAEYDTPGELVDAARRVRDAGYKDFDCYSPFPVHGIDEAMGIKRTILPAIVFSSGLLGTLGGLYLQWWMNAYNWPWNIAGKPAWSIPANIPIAFETTILMSVFASFFGMWILNKLPQVWHPFFSLDRFARVTDDGFMLGIQADDKRFDLETTRKLLADAGALAVEECRLDPDPASRVMPKWIMAMIVASTAFALVPFAIAAKARASHSDQPHWHIFPDMDFQPKYKSDTEMDLFEDSRANRGEIAGTIARGSLNADDTYYRGLTAGADGNAAWTTSFPRQISIDAATMARGKQRFEIYCVPCHGYDGRGNGVVPQRVASLGGSWPARNLADPALTPIHMPHGQLFNTISNGFNTMSGYAAQIPVADRWAIVLYVRALQRAQNAVTTDVNDQQGSIR